MPLIFRAMMRDAMDGKPMVGADARKLGARLPPKPHADIPVATDGSVKPQTGGMSVAPRWRDLPAHRIPKRLQSLFRAAAGSDVLHLWRMGEGPFADGPVTTDLNLRVDPNDSTRHGFVEPAITMQGADYEAALAATRDAWVIDEG